MNNYSKYPRTLHLPWSPGRTDDDKVLKNTNHFENKLVVVTEKMDGENTTLYRSHNHARSMDSIDHVSRHWLKRFHSTVGYNIPDLWRVCGENVYAKHSIHYQQLTHYYYMFSIWNNNNICLSWDETEEWSELLGIPLAPVLYKGIYDDKKIKACFTGQSAFGAEQEGYVVRIVDRFSYDEFESSLAKYVRSEHVQTGEHWMHQEVVPNILKEGINLVI